MLLIEPILISFRVPFQESAGNRTRQPLGRVVSVVLDIIIVNFARSPALEVALGGNPLGLFDEIPKRPFILGGAETKCRFDRIE
jgi:hypothetical protein